MPRSLDTGRLSRLAFALAATVLTAMPAVHAQQTSRWTADEVLARAALPVAADAAIAAAEFSCEAGRWTLALTPTSGTNIAAADAVISVDSRNFEVSAAASNGAIVLRIPQEALQPLSNGLRLSVTFSGPMTDMPVKLNFSLRGSKLAIDALDERCSQRDMSAFQPVTFTPYSSYLGLARELRADDIANFSTSTASQPQVTAAMAEMGEGRRILFTRLCGSSWYFGRSGCNITGFVADTEPPAGGSDASATWRTVYDTEGVALYLDEKSHDHGWRDLITLPTRGRGAALIWQWNGKRYALKGELPAEQDMQETLNLRPSHD